MYPNKKIIEINSKKSIASETENLFLKIHKSSQNSLELIENNKYKLHKPQIPDVQLNNQKRISNNFSRNKLYFPA